MIEHNGTNPFADKIHAQLQEAQSQLEKFEAVAKGKMAQAEVDALNHLKTRRQEIDKKRQELKTAAAARPKPNDRQSLSSLKRHQLDLISTAAVALLSLRASPTRARSTGDGCVGRSFLSSVSSSENSFIGVAKSSSN